MRGKIIHALHATWVLIAHGSLPLLKIEIVVVLTAWVIRPPLCPRRARDALPTCVVQRRRERLLVRASLDFGAA